MQSKAFICYDLDVLNSKIVANIVYGLLIQIGKVGLMFLLS